MQYKCDSCNELFEFEREIFICPFCGFKHLRNISFPMKKVVRAKILLTTRADLIINENKEVEILEILGENFVEKIIEEESSREINNKEYIKLIEGI